MEAGASWRMVSEDRLFFFLASGAPPAYLHATPSAALPFPAMNSSSGCREQLARLPLQRINSDQVLEGLTTTYLAKGLQQRQAVTCVMKIGLPEPWRERAECWFPHAPLGLCAFRSSFYFPTL